MLFKVESRDEGGLCQGVAGQLTRDAHGDDVVRSTTAQLCRVVQKKVGRRSGSVAGTRRERVPNGGGLCAYKQRHLQPSVCEEGGWNAIAAMVKNAPWVAYIKACPKLIARTCSRRCDDCFLEPTRSNMGDGWSPRSRGRLIAVDEPRHETMNSEVNRWSIANVKVVYKEVNRK